MTIDGYTVMYYVGTHTTINGRRAVRTRNQVSQYARNDFGDVRKSFHVSTIGTSRAVPYSNA